MSHEHLWICARSLLWGVPVGTCRCWTAPSTSWVPPWTFSFLGVPKQRDVLPRCLVGGSQELQSLALCWASSILLPSTRCQSTWKPVWCPHRKTPVVSECFPSGRRAPLSIWQAPVVLLQLDVGGEIRGTSVKDAPGVMRGKTYIGIGLVVHRYWAHWIQSLGFQSSFWALTG